MPIYVYKCENGHEFDVYKKIKDIDKKVVCECGQAAKRKIVPTMINCDIQPWDRYISPASGKLITSYKERREDMKAMGCVDYDPGMKTDYQKRIKNDDLALDKAIDQTVEMEIEKMPSHKKEKLENELKHSDIEYTRI